VKYRGSELVAAILAAGIALAIVAICIGVATHEGPISAEESTLIATVLGAAVGAIATYLGTGRGGGDLDDDERAELERYRAEVVPAEVVDNPPTPRPPPATRPDPF
jgi:hypothetical protein